MYSVQTSDMNKHILRFVALRDTRQASNMHNNMMTARGIFCVVLVVIISILLRQNQEQTRQVKHHNHKLATNSYFVERAPVRDREQIGGENATIVMLTRNFELKGALSAMRSLEDRFNKHYKYPWVFLNDVPFHRDFIEQTTLMASGKTYYELIPTEDWDRPSWINETRFEENLRNSEEAGVLYGGSPSYRNMCRFNSGFFYKQKRLLDYEWYFRVEPDVQYMCDFNYDPFKLLRENNKKYGFAITIYEYENTIPTLWPTVEGFMDKYPHLVHANNSLDFITTKDAIGDKTLMIQSSTDYNLCHFWSNFEIGSLEFFRSEPYETYFKHLDETGGFYYERWGDAPVHSIGLNLLLDKAEIHHFEDIGYYHAPFLSCPSSMDLRSVKKCVCKSIGAESQLVDLDVYSCLSRWWKYGGGKKFIQEIDYEYFD